MNVGFEVDSSKKKTDYFDEDQSTFEPIRAASRPAAQRRNLTNEERVDRRKMNRNKQAAYSGPGYYLVNAQGEPQSEKFPTMSDAEAQITPDSGYLVEFLAQSAPAPHLSQPFPAQLQQVNGSKHMYSEADLLTAMAKATPEEAQSIMGELESRRTAARLQMEADNSIDMSNAYIDDVMTPVPVFEHTSAYTDWIDKVEQPNHTDDYIKQALITEATEWFNRTSPEVRRDVEEFAEQAKGMARRSASALGAPDAHDIFMHTAGKLLEAAWGDSAPEGFIAPWSQPPQVLPPTGGGHAPFGVPGGPLNLDSTPSPYTDPYANQQDGGMNGTNYNPMAEQVHPGWVGQPLDNGHGAWPAYEFLEGEENPLPAASAPDGYDPTGGTSKSPSDVANTKDDNEENETVKTSTRKEATPGHFQKGNAHGEYDSQSGKPFGTSAYGWDPEKGDWHSDTHQDYRDGYGKGYSSFYNSGELGGRGPSPRVQIAASEAFNGPKQTYSDYENRKSEGAYPMDEEHFAGSMAAVSPAPDNTTIPVTAMVRWAERGIKPDPQGNNLAGNPMSGYGDGNNYDRDEAHAQSGEAQTELPLAPEGGQSAEMFSQISQFPSTGPTEVPSDRAFNVETNAGQDDDQGAENDRFKESLSALHLAEIPGRGKDQKGKDFEPDRGLYAQSPAGQAASTQAYEEAYSSNRHIDYSETGIGPLGTVPVQGYGTNPHGEMFNVDQWALDGQSGTGAADVANVPAPGMEGGPGDPDDLNNPQFPEGKEARLQAVRDRVRANLNRG